jgi:DEAD-box helicase
MALYRLDVGKRHNVRPGAVVGALANEGGLNSKDFGRIHIGFDHTLVELPKDLPQEVFDNLADTRISGQPIRFERDPGAPGRSSNRRDRDRGDYRDRRDNGRNFRRRDDRGYRGNRRDRDRGFRGDR